MFDDKTQEKVLEELLSSVVANVDKRQGSIIYDSLTPKSFIIAKFYQDLSWMIDNILFVDTATGEYLDKKGYEFGVTRRKAISTTRNATFVGTIIPDKTRFFTEDGLYWTYDLANNNVICETFGIIGNSTITGSNLIPAIDIQGLTSAIIKDVVIPGADIETDEDYRAKIITKLQNPELNSNKAQIKKWCNDITGVGDARIFSLWNGANTVKGVLIDTEKQPASTTLIKQVQDYIDPDAQGLGEGKADIGVIFTAQGATSTAIDISFRITQLASGSTLDNAKVEVTEGIKTYLKGVAFKQEKTKDVVRYQEISALILNTVSIIDFENLTINTGTGNIEVELDHVAILGTLTVTQ